MKKSIIPVFCLLLTGTIALAQTHRDGDPNYKTGFDYVALGIGLVVGLLIGYLLGTRSKKA